MSTRYLRTLLSSMALLALAAPAPMNAAATSVPASGYGQFTGCPHPGQNPSIVTCFRSFTTGGDLKIGNKTIAISRSMVLSGGITAGGAFDFNTFGALQKSNSK